MNISESTKHGITIVSVKSPRIDASSAPEFKDALGAVVSRGVPRFVLDLSAVSFIDSTGLGALIAAVKALGRTGGVAVSGASDPVATLFRVTRMDKVFRMFASDEEAAAALVTA